MLLPIDENEVKITGNISFIDIRNGKHGVFGTINIAVDASYKNLTNQQWVERTIYVAVEVGNSFVKVVNNPEVGSRLSIKGKLITPEFTDNKTQKLKTVMKVKCMTVIAYTSKSERSAAKEVYIKQ